MFALVSLTAVSAVDTNQTDDLAAEDSDTVTQDILTDESVGGGDFKELNDNFTSATTTLELTKNYTYNPDVDLDYKDGINITKDITVDGKGYTIDGNSQSRIFNIVNATVTLKNINFINGYADSGAAICCNGGNLTIIGCNFLNNNAYDPNMEGGAVDFMGNDLAIDNSIFANNEAALNSAAISFSGNSLLVNNSEFKSNRAKEFAGAVGVEDAVDVRFINTEFYNNSARNYAALGIYDGNVLMDNCTFDANHADDEVGAVYLNCADSLIKASFFTNNTAKNTILAHAGSSLDVDNCQFIGNYADSGNIIHNAMDANLTLSNSILNFMKISPNNNFFKVSIYACWFCPLTVNSIMFNFVYSFFGNDFR